MSRNILVTSALPYANGDIHIGHLVEYIQTDIWVRFQKLRGNRCLYLCADDAHGTPIMLSAEAQNITPDALIKDVQARHEHDFADFLIEFDNFYTTHSDENRTLSENIYRHLRDNGDIETRTIEQAFDAEKEMFLPDRFVKGECPRCGTADQYGDNCEHCGATYSPADLNNPISVLSGTPPITKDSEHFFFNLAKYQPMLEDWLASGHLQPAVVNKLKEWFATGLNPWDISRDAPYFGFEIPDAPGKYFYVWLDAPIGYMASLKNMCAQRDDIKFDDYWRSDADTELYHFIGKDIIYFHALFWPAILKAAGYRAPTAIFAHGFLTVNGQKMSKSRGTFIKARTYLEHLDPEYLRYYFAAKLNSGIDDLDLNFEDFMQRINADLVGKVVNIASRCAGFITKHFDGKLADSCSEPELLRDLVSAGESIAELYETREYSHAIRDIMALADRTNQYINDKAPWQLIKLEGNEKEVQEICSVGLNCFRLIMLYLKPVLPKTAANSEAFLNIEPMTWAARGELLIDHAIHPFKPLLQRIDQKQVAELSGADVSQQ